MPAIGDASADEALPNTPTEAFREDDLGLAGFVAAITPMFLVDLTLIIVLLLVEPRFTGSQTAALPVTTMDNRTLVALAASTIVFPVLLQPLIRMLAGSFFRNDSYVSLELDRVLSYKFGFAWSDFAQELDAVLDQPDRERLRSLWTRLEYQRLRSSSYFLSFLPLAATAAILWGQFHFGGIVAAFSLFVVAWLLLISTQQSARRITRSYWSLQGSLAVRYRFDIFRSLSLRPPTNLADERRLWQAARAVTVTASDLMPRPLTLSTSRTPVEERRIRYAYELSSGGTTESAAPSPAEPWVVEYDGFVSARWRPVPNSAAGRESSGPLVDGTLDITIDRTEQGSNAERISVGGRRAPYAEFRVMPDSDDVDVRPSELILRPSSDSAATGAFTTTRRRLGHENPRLWVRVYQHKRLVANLAVDWGTESGDPE